MSKKKFFRKLYTFIFFVFILYLFQLNVFATGIDPIDTDSIQSSPIINIEFSGQNLTGQTDPTLQLLFLIALITLAPTILIMLTAFTRIIIGFHFMRSALGTQQMPPNQVLIGLSLFLTFFVMGPTFSEINDVAIQPYSEGIITTAEAAEAAMNPIREFMFSQVDVENLRLFAEIEGTSFADKDDIPNRVLIPAFILGEITIGFKFGFILFIPFLVIDMVVASILMAMGMMMLPPAMISLPFKVMFFVLVDGWALMIGSLMESFF